MIFILESDKCFDFLTITKIRWFTVVQCLRLTLWGTNYKIVLLFEGLYVVFLSKIFLLFLSKK